MINKSKKYFKMKLKSILILVIFSLMSYSPMQAEGLFNKSNGSNQKAADPKNGGKVLRDPPPPGGGGPGLPQDYDPISDGLLILTLLAGGYTVIRARKKEKNS
jgi:hypothetical protein